VRDDALQFGLLGPVEVRRDGSVLDLGPPGRRVLLIRLLMEDGRVVPVDQLCEDLWQRRPPAGALSSLHAHVSRLRAVLEPSRRSREPATVLRTGPSGYALDVPPQARDTVVFEDAVGAARRLLDAGDLVPARDRVEHGLGLWRGGPLMDASLHDFAAREISRLQEMRLAAEELRTTILFRQGDVQEAALAAEGLIAKAPLREAAWVLLMKALYASDRPAEALRRYETVRRTLSEELGIDPGPALQQAHLAILRYDSEALRPDAPPAGSAVLPQPVHGRAAPQGSLHHESRPYGRVRPVRLLAPEEEEGEAENRASTVRRQPSAPHPQPLVGRERELSWLADVLDDAAAGRTGWVVLSGEAGIGRTRLAEEFAARASSAGFAVAWARCASADGATSFAALLDPACQLMSALDAPPPGASQESAARDLRDELARRPTVCVIDDLHCAGEEFRRTLAMFATLLRGLPLVVMCTVQDDLAVDSELAAFLALLVRRGGALTLPLAPLSMEDIGRLLADGRGGAGQHPHGRHSQQREAAELWRRSDGNPFFLTEMLKLPAEAQAGPGAQMPASVRSVLRARIDGVSRPARELLEATAVSGPYFDVDLIMRVTRTSPTEMPALIDAAVTARLLVWSPGACAHAGGAYELPELPRQALLDRLTSSRRQALNLALARVLDERRPRGQPVRVARHFFEAGPMAPGDELARAALRVSQADPAGTVSAHELATWLDRAAPLTTDPTLRAEVEQAVKGLRSHRAV
jgi:DNA-binding SARP family transcriptional activator